MRHLFPISGFAIAMLASLPGASSATPAVDFNREVRPILSANCLKCHGIDDGARKAKLRLDVRETAVAPAKSGKIAIVPGAADSSELVRRIFSGDPDVVMPPASTHVTLTADQKHILREWIAQGAPYATHWAFVPPVQAPLPAVSQAEWPRNAIDRFVMARLEAEKLKPSPEADRYALIRRLSLDLIGLPPTPTEADAFVNDRSPDAYEKVVDRLLASPHYGERWARRWLDLARYADTNGFEKDRPRSVWPYRDWVINAMNADMPFDQFTIEQLAGDLLPDATAAQKIATGFHRNTMLNEEGGIDPLEYRYYATVDRVGATGTVWLGLTVRCAQCHTHKFDPITHKEYYQLMAFLNNADEPEFTLPPTAAQEQTKTQIEARIAKLTDELPDHFPVTQPTTRESSDEPEFSPRQACDRAFESWSKAESTRAVKWTVLRPDEMHSGMPILTAQPDGSVLAGGDVIKSDAYDLTFHTGLAGITAVRVEALPDDTLPRRGPGMVFYEGGAGDFFLSEISLNLDGNPAKFARAESDFAAKGFGAEKAIDGDPQTGWSINGQQGKPHVAVFTLSQPTTAARELKLRMLFERYFAAPLGHFRISVTADTRKPGAAVLPPAVEAVLAEPEASRAPEGKAALFDYFKSIAPELAGPRKEIDRLRASIPEPPTTLVMREWPAGHVRPTFVHHRGEFLQTEDAVSPGVPSFLPPLPAGAPPNRLTFARWLVSADNPLTARVTVNRQWQAFFGRGIVRTLEDFGYQGELPSHPELLDWLAVQFMKDGWSIKKLHRLIVTSATYRQASRTPPEVLDRDPQNVLLARGPRVREEAEIVRDSALRAAQLLSEKIGGPSVYPPQPASVTTEGTYGALAWTATTGEDRFRRSLYTFSKRTAPFAMYNTFDAPTGEECVARRESSDTPLQALTLLNDTMFVEAAQNMGRTYADSKQPDEARAADLFRHCLTRPPEADELARIVAFAREQRGRFAAGKLDAARVAGGGGPGAVERATWTVVARAIMNLDETVTKE